MMAEDVVVSDWLASNMLHHSASADLGQVVSLKRKSGKTVSAVIPTLNEERTIGTVVTCIRDQLMREFPLVDEIVVVDSSSTDNTVDIARDSGAAVFVAREILPGFTPRRGKGENLWKSLFCVRGDIIVYTDADIRNFSHHFIAGLIGPLLVDPNLRLAKGFYRRPLIIGDEGEKNDWGGRVTEIFVRPMLSQFFPEMTGFIQPLSGEFAATRSTLEGLSFPVSYGVDLGILIDIVQKFGLASVVQVDLDTRVHRNRDTKYLGRMAFEILQIFLRRVRTYRPDIGLADIITPFFLQFEGTEPVIHEISAFEQPPIVTVDAYLNGAAGDDRAGAQGGNPGRRLRHATAPVD